MAPCSRELKALRSRASPAPRLFPVPSFHRCIPGAAIRPTGYRTNPSPGSGRTCRSAPASACGIQGMCDLALRTIRSRPRVPGFNVIPLFRQPFAHSGVSSQGGSVHQSRALVHFWAKNFTTVPISFILEGLFEFSKRHLFGTRFPFRARPHHRHTGGPI